MRRIIKVIEKLFLKPTDKPTTPKTRPLDMLVIEDILENGTNEEKIKALNCYYDMVKYTSERILRGSLFVDLLLLIVVCFLIPTLLTIGTCGTTGTPNHSSYCKTVSNVGRYFFDYSHKPFE